MAATMKDVAREAKVSLGTVSNYVNGKATVSEKNRTQIEMAIAKLGYQVNEVARNLRVNSSKTIGVIIPSFSNVFAVKAVSQLERLFGEEDYSTYVMSYRYHQEALTEAIKTMVSKQVDGLVIMPTHAMSREEIETINNYMSRGSIPMVAFDAFAQGMLCDHVLMDNYSAVSKAMDTLFDHGHSNIALFLGPQNIHSSQERLSAYLDAYTSRNLTVETANILHTDYSKAVSKRLCLNVLETSQVTAIATTGYRITLGVLAAIYEQQKRIPEDISLVGFDIADIADITPNRLYGTVLPHEEIGAAVVNAIMSRITSGEEASHTITEIGIEYVHGDSVKKINS